MRGGRFRKSGSVYTAAVIGVSYCDSMYATAMRADASVPITNQIVVF